MPPIDPEREVVGRTIAAVLMARQIRQGGSIHPETVLTEIGALAGFSAQMSIRKGMIEPQRMDPSNVLSEVVTKNGEKYYFSDLLNWIVFENLDRPPYSIWAYIRDGVPETERRFLPDMGDILGHAARAIGTARFGIPVCRPSMGHAPCRVPPCRNTGARYSRSSTHPSVLRPIGLTISRSRRSGTCTPAATGSRCRSPRAS